MNALAPVRIESFRADGSVLDLAHPCPTEVSFPVIAGRLSRIARFNAVPEMGAYSVAQHCVHGAESLLREGADEMTAALFLLHDAHEALLGDIPSPMQALLEAVHGPGVRDSIARIKSAWDEAIYAAAGLPPPSAWKASWHSVVVSMDRRLLFWEAKELLGEQAGKHLGRAQPRPSIVGTFKPWQSFKAEMTFREMFDRLVGQRAPVKIAENRR